MQYLIKILFLIISIIFSYEFDSSFVNHHKNDYKAILIPDYRMEGSKFKIEYLDKKKKFFIDISLDHLDEENSLRINISPILKYKQFKFKMNLDYLFSDDSSNYNNNWSNTFDVLERIEYLEYSLFNDKINLFLGNIKNLSFGHGYLLSNYNNSYKFPIIRNLGLKFKYENSNSSVTYNLFISSLRDFTNRGGLVGNRFSILISDEFPLRIGFGHIIDLNQFLNYQEQFQGISREINAFEIDFRFPFIDFIDKKLFFIGEISAIDHPEKRYYKRVDDNQFTNDKKSREGIWGIAFPGIKYIGNMLEFSLAANYNSAIYSPYYFNSTYDFEKVRFRQYNILENETLYIDEAELLGTFSNSDSTLFIPKDMYGMINDFENTYPTYGFLSSLKLKINKKHQLDLSYSYFENISDIENSFFNTISFNYLLYKKIIFFPTILELYFSKNFFKLEELYQYDENLIYGLNLDLTIYKSLSLSGKFKHTFYDLNLDGKIDLVPYVSVGLNYKY
tara:strand:- start:472 stop:1986 length:1515 start_codon:yes stop_codon:yes gene_type:complete